MNPGLFVMMRGLLRCIYMSRHLTGSLKWTTVPRMIPLFRCEWTVNHKAALPYRINLPYGLQGFIRGMCWQKGDQPMTCESDLLTMEDKKDLVFV